MHVTQMDYQVPHLRVVGDDDVSLEEAEAWWVIPIYLVGIYGGAWAWCKLMCLGNGGVKNCKTSWWRGQVEVTCKG